jgi:hypothetical protein
MTFNIYKMKKLNVSTQHESIFVYNVKTKKIGTYRYLLVRPLQHPTHFMFFFPVFKDLFRRGFRANF